MHNEGVRAPLHCYQGDCMQIKLAGGPPHASQSSGVPCQSRKVESYLNNHLMRNARTLEHVTYLLQARGALGGEMNFVGRNEFSYCITYMYVFDLNRY